MRALALVAAFLPIGALALPAGAQVGKVVPESTFKVLRAQFGTLDTKDPSQPGLRPTTKPDEKIGRRDLSADRRTSVMLVEGVLVSTFEFDLE